MDKTGNINALYKYLLKCVPLASSPGPFQHHILDTRMGHGNGDLRLVHSLTVLNMHS